MDIIPLKGEQSSITSRRTMANSLKVPAAQVGTLANVRGLPDAARTAPEVAKQSSTACGRLAACKS
jgi:hypothetical protein